MSNQYLEEASKPLKDSKDSLVIARAKIKLAEFERNSRSQKSSKDPYLYTALNSCLEAVIKLPQELAQIDETIAELKASAPVDPATKIRVDYLE